MEKEVVQLKRDAEDKAMQINQLDVILKEAQSELDEKTNEGNLAILFSGLPLIMLFLCVLGLIISLFIIKYKQVRI